MILNSASPTRIPNVNEQLLALRKRRSVVDRLVRCLEDYHRITPIIRVTVKSRVA
jgi:hypothetical protein